MNRVHENKSTCFESDQDLLTILSQWIKFERSDPGQQEEFLSKLGSFSALFTVDQYRLRHEFNMAEKDIVLLYVIYEAVLRTLKSKIYNKNILQSKKCLTDYLIVFLSREPIEHFYIYLLDEHKHVVSMSHQAKGTVSTASIYIREVAKYAFRYAAESLILVHNHPSGLALPSEADKQLTNILVKALDAVNIKIADHLIIGNGSYFSFADHGLLSPLSLKKIKQL